MPKLLLTAIGYLKERVKLRFIILERMRLYPYCCDKHARFIEEGYSFLEEKRDQLQGTEVPEEQELVNEIVKFLEEFPCWFEEEEEEALTTSILESNPSELLRSRQVLERRQRREYESEYGPPISCIIGKPPQRTAKASGEFKCDRCPVDAPRTFPSKGGLTTHLQKGHQHVDGCTEDIDVEPYEFFRAKPLANGKGYHCNRGDCKETFPNKERLAEHINKHKKSVVCKDTKCGRKLTHFGPKQHCHFKCRENGPQATPTPSQTPARGKYNYECDICSENIIVRFTTEENLQLHKKITHQQVLGSSEKITPTQSQPQVEVEIEGFELFETAFDTAIKRYRCNRAKCGFAHTDLRVVATHINKSHRSSHKCKGKECGVKLINSMVDLCSKCKQKGK